jgi:hypothetical protein
MDTLAKPYLLPFAGKFKLRIYVSTWAKLDLAVWACLFILATFRRMGTLARVRQTCKSREFDINP